MITVYTPQWRNPYLNKELRTKFHELINTCINRQFNEEKIQGYSGYYTKIQQLQLALMFAIYIKKRLYFGETLDEVEADFEIDRIKYRLQANGINLYKVYDTLEIDYQS